MGTKTKQIAYSEAQMGTATPEYQKIESGSLIFYITADRRIFCKTGSPRLAQTFYICHKDPFTTRSNVFNALIVSIEAHEFQDLPSLAAATNGELRWVSTNRSFK